MRAFFCLLVISAMSTSCGKDDPEIRPTGGDDVGPADMTLGRDGSNPDVRRPDFSSVDGLVQTTHGPVSGVSDGGVTSFKGIPYAAPPVGPLRFQPPQTPAGWQEPFVAEQYGPICPQRDRSSTASIGDEDCLTLNVWAPDDAGGLPVMFFIHGGGFTRGSGSDALYDGTNLSQQEIVVVTINYRLGALGFLADESLAQESDADTAGNYGLLDQVLALEWVQDNISSFGGDPDNVTIFGESAGAVSVCAHLGSPASDGLFARGIIESGSGCDNFVQLRTATPTHDPAVMTGAQYVAAAGCDGAGDTVQCLRDLPFGNVVDAMYDLAATGLGLAPFGPNIDGVFLSDDPVDLLIAGTARDVPVITGSNADEATIFTFGTRVATVVAYETIVRTTFGALGDQVLAIYPAADFATPKDAYNAVFSDVSFICPALRFADLVSDDEPAWAYHLTRVLPGGAALGAFHGLELFYVFGNFDAAPAYTANADDLALHDAMIQAWTGFARNGSTDWPAYSPSAPSVRLFDTTVETVPEIRNGRCADLVTLGVIP